MKLLLHTCCGPCFLGTWGAISEKFEVTNLFYNPNIQPKEEYRRRLVALKLAASGKSERIVELDYLPDEHKRAIQNNTHFPTRCTNCYRLRLEHTAKYAVANGFDFFSTTLLVSPYQQHAVIKSIGLELADTYGLAFYYEDFRQGFRDGQDQARALDVYRQKYCGCLLSKSEARQ